MFKKEKIAPVTVRAGLNRSSIENDPEMMLIENLSQILDKKSEKRTQSVLGGGNPKKMSTGFGTI